jgi:hypothetical protein
MAADGGSQIEQSGWIREASGGSQRSWWSFWCGYGERKASFFVGQQVKIAEEGENELRGDGETIILARGEKSGSRS